MASRPTVAFNDVSVIHVVVSDRGGDRTRRNVGLERRQGVGTNETSWPWIQGMLGALMGGRSLLTLRLADVIGPGFNLIAT